MCFIIKSRFSELAEGDAAYRIRSNKEYDFWLECVELDSPFRWEPEIQAYTAEAHLIWTEEAGADHSELPEQPTLELPEGMKMKDPAGDNTQGNSSADENEKERQRFRVKISIDDYHSGQSEWFYMDEISARAGLLRLLKDVFLGIQFSEGSWIGNKRDKLRAQLESMGVKFRETPETKNKS